MKKILLLTTAVCLFCAPAFATTVDGSQNRRLPDRLVFEKARQAWGDVEKVPQKYTDFKNWLAEKTGLTYSWDMSLMPQRSVASGKKTAWQFLNYATANWDAFESDMIGKGSVQFAYTLNNYWGASANRLASNTGLITPMNDYPGNEHEFNQLTYTHQFPCELDWLSMTIGQFPLSNFDGTSYDSNQQMNFLNYSLSQNASSTYPTASLGGYVTISPDNNWSFVAGMQDAHNISGRRISFKDFGKGNYTAFGGATFTPTYEFGTGEYSVLAYYQPSVRAEPTNSWGWSLNAMQNFGKFGVFGRINGTSNSSVSIEQSYVLGGVINNPLDRNPLDQIGAAMSFNKLNKGLNGEGTRAAENVLEAYWAWGVSNFMTLTPDIQLYVNPGASDKHTAAVYSVRATMMF